MLTLVHGSKARARHDVPARAVALTRLRQAGFTLIEVMIVMAIVAIGAALISVALPDRAQSQLDEEGLRLAALLESARAEARASGLAVRWAPAADGSDDANFHFTGLPPGNALPTRWLDAAVRADVVGASAVLLGPEPVLPAQRVVLRLNNRRLVLASDGLGAFAPLPEAADASGEAP